MYKEFGIIFVIFLTVAVIMRSLYKKDNRRFRIVTVVGLAICILLNIGYNILTVFPDFVYEGVPIGDSRENLFVYKSDSQFEWQILNRVAENRTVLLDGNGGMYQRYFDIFAEKCAELEIAEPIRESVWQNKTDFDETAELSMIKQLTYAFPEWEREELPVLYLNTEELSGCSTLVAIVDEQDNLYVMSEVYYETVLQEEIQ